MSSLQYTERNLLEKILGMKTGYVSDFSDRTLREFVLEVTGIDIFAKAYEENGTSKANRIRTFWKKESDDTIGLLVGALLKHARYEKENFDRELSAHEERNFAEAEKIVQRLKDASASLSIETSSSSGLTSMMESRPQDANIKQSLFSFLSDPRFPQQKRKFETVRDHFPTLNEFELKRLLSEIGAIRYRSSGSDLWGIPAGSVREGPVHVAGDYIVGDKIGRDKNATPKPRWLSNYWWGLIIPVVVVVVAYMITEGKFPQAFNFMSQASVQENYSLATSTPNLAVILNKNNSFTLSSEKQEFIKNYENTAVYGSGSFQDLIKIDQGYTVLMTISNNMIGCQFGLDSEKSLLLLKKGQTVNFSGLFTGSGLGGYGAVNPWYITDCILLNK